MDKPKFIIDGKNFKTFEEFYDEISIILSPPEWWDRNLDAFNDILPSDFMPEQGYVIIWKNSHLSRQFLGYEETARQISKQLEKCHPDNIPSLQKKLTEAKTHIGTTVFDWLVEIIRDHCPGGSEADDQGELIVE